MNTNIIVFIDWNHGVWVLQYRNNAGEMVTELTGFPASTPSIVVCDAIQESRPGARLFAKLG